jgi:hypothetical protein
LIGDKDLIPLPLMDDEEDFLHLLQLMLAEQQGDELEDEVLASFKLGLVCYGSKKPGVLVI